MIVTLLNEGLALVSSNAFITAWACIATADADALRSVFDVAGALDLEAFGANLNCLHPVIEQARPFPAWPARCASSGCCWRAATGGSRARPGSSRIR